MNLLKEIQEKIKNLSADKELENKRIFLFGCNGYVERINNFLHEEGYELSGIIDNDKEKQGKRICSILVCAPESIDWGLDDVVLIASRYKDSMVEQIKRISDEVNIIILIDILKYNEEYQKKERFWLEENYDEEILKLNTGARIYQELKQNEILIVVAGFSLGDVCLSAFFFQEFERKIYPKSIKLILASQGLCKVAQLFGERKVAVISQLEIDSLVKFMLFDRPKEDIICGNVCTLDVMAQYKRILVPTYWARFFYRLDNNYKMCFPSIWDNRLNEAELENKGLVKGRTVILAPYANTIEELPCQFWELLVKKLLEMKYYIFTNVAGKQKPVKGSTELDIPLNQIGSYLEFAGYFVSIRNGLCEVVGRSKCKQIIFYRNKLHGQHRSQIEFFDLHAENVSESAIQCVYDDNDLLKNVDRVTRIVRNTENY